jgi:hypothetical protein
MPLEPVHRLPSPFQSKRIGENRMATGGTSERSEQAVLPVCLEGHLF